VYDAQDFAARGNVKGLNWWMIGARIEIEKNDQVYGEGDAVSAVEEGTAPGGASETA
jgi:hypothetical protein